MNTNSPLKLLSVFLIGAVFATAVVLPLTSSRRHAEPAGPATAPAPEDKAPAASGASFSSADQPGQTLSNGRVSSAPSRGTGEAPSQSTDFSAASVAPAPAQPLRAPNRSAFATSSLRVGDSPSQGQPEAGTPLSSSNGNGQNIPAASSAAAMPAASSMPSYGATPNSTAAGQGSYVPAAAPLTGGGTAGAATMEIDPSATIPASLAKANPAAKLTPEEQALADDLGKQFLGEVGNASPNDPATAQTWNTAQRRNDELYKLYFGYQAYNVQNASAYRDSVPQNQTGTNQ